MVNKKVSSPGSALHICEYAFEAYEADCATWGLTFL